MITSVYADQNSFKRIELRKGLNAIIAERSATSSSRDSRNGSGKTSLIEIIHFCLGSSAKRNVLLDKNLSFWKFSIEIELRGKSYTVSRSTNMPTIVEVDGDTSDWPIRPKYYNNQISVKDWTFLLGWLMFDLELSESGQYGPTFRSIIPYFARRGQDAFSVPFEHIRKQPAWEKQVSNAFLLGLSWEDAQEWQKLKDKKEALENLVAAAKAGWVTSLLGSMGELESKKVQLMSDAEGFRQQLKEFKVHPQYSHIEESASALTSQIHELSNMNVSDRRLVQYYTESLSIEKSAQPSIVSKVYEEAGVVFPDRVLKRLQDVQSFHESIVANRKNFLEQEIKNYSYQIRKRDEQIRNLSDHRSRLMSVLESHGALEEHAKLQEQLNAISSELDKIVGHIRNLKEIESARVDLKLAEAELERRSRNDYDDRASIRNTAISLFNSTSRAMYESPGSLIIDVAKNGFKFDVQMPRSTSQGIEKMKVFCYDLMLSQLWSNKKIKPGFLIHDSTLFDGVDERQFAKALELAHEVSTEAGFQYICCLNSDVIPWDDFTSEFNLQSHKVLELTDQPGGGLFGFRY